MNPFSVHSYQDPVGPDDLCLLQKIFDCELEFRKLRVDSEEAEILAQRLIDLFQSGVRREDALREMLTLGSR
ncbi:hypothetical protein ABIE78_001241 [Sinorhizobium fredii]|uniref:Uncharacterized protein n=1 Tax=Sinorhizobium fredii (strain USDA 257) TaxID=1185652 RepID=I3XAG4_SINF2|nr:hypothetical protein [Sinorhizobium fredii]AFL52870.1 hypothetical protein USDA257_c43310 [Sinorhizobium fredii USDA 257]